MSSSMEKCAGLVPELLLKAPKENKRRDLAKLLRESRGVAFLQVRRIGAIVTLRYGKGILLGKLQDDSWSPPCGVVMQGPALGASIGAEQSNFIIFLQTQGDVDGFSVNGISAGINATGALGSLGRTGEASIKTNTGGYVIYADSVGLYGGVSLELTGITVDRSVNEAQYGAGTTSEAIIHGNVAKPSGGNFDRMYAALEQTQAAPG
jgi:lipid-binding SYLF domain-containing protein